MSAQAPGVAPITLTALRNTTYPSAYTASHEAPLKDGRYSEQAPGAATPVTVEFVTDAVAPTFAAVALATTDASGTHATLHIVTAAAAGLVASDGVALGDGVTVQSVAIVGGQVTVRLLQPAPGDRPGHPTAQTTRTFTRAGGGFASAADSVATVATTTGPAPSATGSAGALGRGAPASLAAELAVLAVTLAVAAAARAAGGRRSRGGS